MSACRSGCPTQDHKSWGDCARAANLRYAWLTSQTGLSRTADKASEHELQEYRDLRKQGIQPAGTTRRALEEAKRTSDLVGKAYNAEQMPPTALISDKRTVKAASEAGML